LGRERELPGRGGGAKENNGGMSKYDKSTLYTYMKTS
jgi:hypothetical protein